MQVNNGQPTQIKPWKNELKAVGKTIRTLTIGGVIGAGGVLGVQHPTDKAVDARTRQYMQEVAPQMTAEDYLAIQNKANHQGRALGALTWQEKALDLRTTNKAQASLEQGFKDGVRNIKQHPTLAQKAKDYAKTAIQVIIDKTGTAAKTIR